MSEKDKANPEQRVTMEQRWAAARAACDAGTCDPGEKKFHRAGCERKGMAAENWGDTPVVDQTGGWCAPSRCEVGICTDAERHDASCQGPGHAYQMMRNADTTGPLLELPEVKVKRGGLRWPITRLEWAIKPRHTLFRKRYSVGWRVLGVAGEINWIDGFHTREDADNAARQLDKVNLEINRRRDQIDDAAR